MMQQIRDSLNGPVIIGVLLLIIGIPFAFSGVQGYFQASANPVVATIGDTEITQEQLRRAYDQRYQQLQQLLGENFRADQINSQRMRASVLQDLVQDALLKARADAAGFRASDSALREYLTTIPAFQVDGAFSAQRYRELLAVNGLSADSFEAQQRDALAVQQLRDAVVGTALVTEDDGLIAIRLDRQQRDFDVLEFDPAKYRDPGGVSDADVAARYESRKPELRSPERIKLAYVELAQSRLAPSAAPTQEVLRTLYDAELARFTTPEIRDAAHILINAGADKGAARERASAIRARIKAGEDFAALAASESDDSGSKTNGGLLGPVKRGDAVFPKAFEDALFGLTAVGEVTEPVETDFGFHLIRLAGLQPGATQAFDDAAVQKQLGDLYAARELSTRLRDASEKLEQLAFENESTLEPVAAELGLTVETTDWFTRAGGAGIAATPAVLEAAFSEAVLTEGVNSKPIALDADRLVVIRKAEYEAPRQLELVEVADRLRAELVDEQAKAKAKADADAALAALKNGKAISALVTDRSGPVVERREVSRSTSGIGLALIDAVFKLPRPTAGTSPGIVDLEGGGTAVISLVAVRDGVVQAANERDTERLAVRDARAGAEFAAYEAALKQVIKVDVRQDAAADAPVEP